MTSVLEILSEVQTVKNLLSISSHVVHGSVGNDAIQFPLNLRNWNIDSINTTNLSTHPGHGALHGGPVPADLVAELYEGLVKIGMNNVYDAVIVGYAANDKTLETIWANVLKTLPPNVMKVMDPVMGDNGKLYVSEDIKNLYLKLLGDGEVIIDLLTPNQFEMEVLTSIKIDSWESLKEALNTFWKRYNSVKNLVITSISLNKQMYCVGTNKDKVCCYKVREVNAIFSGSGDLFLGILTDEFFKCSTDLVTALGKTIKTIENVLKVTYEISKVDKETKKRIINKKIYIPDLRLIESKHLLLEDDNVIPQVTYLF